MSIRRLPDDVVGKIRSAATITSLNGVVCGLLKNSLDAGATKVNIHVDYGRGNSTVVDNGYGMTPGEFAEDGGLGKLHFTSKYPHSSGIHGRQGTFLASVAVLSLMTITSHHYRYNSHNSITIHHGRVLKRRRPALPEERLEIFDHGTRVAVHDLFGSMPVRVKHRATLFSDRAAIDKEWARLVHDVVALLLAWPSEVSVSMKESKGQEEIYLKSASPIDVVSRTMRLLMQASLADSLDVESWVPVSASTGHIIIKGCISLDPVATRRSQFISLGILPILDEYGSNVLYEEINKVFKNSSFGIIGPETNISQGVSNSETKIKLRKGVDRWPMFYVRISLKGSVVALDAEDALSGRQKDLEEIISLLKALSYGFLKKHHLRPQKVDVFSNKSVFSTQTTARHSTRASTSKGQKSSDDNSANEKSARINSTDPTSRWSHSPFNSWHGSKSHPPISSAMPNMMIQNEPQLTECEKGVSDLLVCEKSAEKNVDWETRTSQRKLLETQPEDEPSEWLQNVLKSWENPVFETTEPLVPQLNGEVMDVGKGHGSHRCYGGDSGGVNFEAGSLSLHGRVSREALMEAQVISQVDCKFILLKLPWRSMSTAPSSFALVMLDQHAADERRRLEDLMAQYFHTDFKTGSLRAVTESLEKPIFFEVSSQEGRLLERYKDHFEIWGIIYSTQAQKSSRLEKKDDLCKVMVKALPPSILERCRSEPRLLVEVVRKEIWRLNDEGIRTSQPQPQVAEPTSDRVTTANFHSCPRGILELLHSRSCRSAIMFNDVLSKEECENLVRDLARCALPFQCAHGRPSMVPLVDLGLSCQIGGWDRGGGGGGGGDARATWKNWMDDSEG